MRSLKRGMVATLACAAIGGAGIIAAPALAGIVFPKSKVTIRAPAPNTFRGAVKSWYRKCRVRRKVVIKRAQPGKDAKLGGGKTNRRGRYSIRVGGVLGGDYYARAVRKLNVVSARGYDCRPARSKLLHIDFPESG